MAACLQVKTQSLGQIPQRDPKEAQSQEEIQRQDITHLSSNKKGRKGKSSGEALLQWVLAGELLKVVDFNLPVLNMVG